ncbi:MAG: hypothetical protein NZ899_12420 [Thermoguttaceae bacterium]|nr:hypothetical protein [Thermoguttaceae bacterium]MDW8078465.1 hypothetical protein [Thermoguttaceae bacterium]
MSIGPGIVGLAGLAGAPFAQTKGKEVDRSAEATAQEAHRLQSERMAERASGVGQTDGEDHHAQERDADGRRPWEIPERPHRAESSQSQSPQSPRDPTGKLGQLLDLTG